MNAEIIKRKIVPDKFTLYEKDANTGNIVFTANTVTDGVNLNGLTAYMSVEFPSGETDKFLLSATSGDGKYYYTLDITSSLTRECGTAAAQLSFESADKSTIMKTDKFVIEIADAVDGNAAYSSVTPSAITSLETQLSAALDECREIKTAVDGVKAEMNAKVEELKSSNVTSVNGKTGDVTLSYSDVQALSADTEMPVMLKNPETITVDGVTYDGSEEVTVTLEGEYFEVIDFDVTLSPSDKNSYFIPTPKTVRLTNDGFSKNKIQNATVFINCLEGLAFTADFAFEFAGDCCADGNFIPAVGLYRMDMTAFGNGGKVYTNVKKFSKSAKEYVDRGGLPAKIISGAGATYNVTVYGNAGWNDELIENTDDPFTGVGDPVSEGSDAGRYKIQIVSQTQNYLKFGAIEETVAGLTLKKTESADGITVSGTVSGGGSVVIPVSVSALTGKFSILKAFKTEGNVSSSSLGCLMEISVVGESGDILTTGVNFTGSDCAVTNKSATGKVTEDVTGLKITVPEGTDGTVFNAVFGFVLTDGDAVSEYTPYKESVSDIIVKEPLRKLGDVYDEVCLNTGKVTRRIRSVVIKSKAQVFAENTSATAAALYKPSKYTTLVSGNLSPDLGLALPLRIAGVSKEDTLNAMTPAAGYIKLNPDWYGTYKQMTADQFPIRLIYVLKSPKSENILRKTAVMLYDGETHVYVRSGVKASGGNIKTVKN